MICKKCGYETLNPVFNPVYREAEATLLSERVPTCEVIYKRWACEQCGRYHFPDGELYTNPYRKDPMTIPAEMLIKTARIQKPVDRDETTVDADVYNDMVALAHRMASLLESQEAELYRLKRYEQLVIWAMAESWQGLDVDAGELHDRALLLGVAEEVPGGYDPEVHDDYWDTDLQKGDPLYRLVPEATE